MTRTRRRAGFLFSLFVGVLLGTIVSVGRKSSAAERRDLLSRAVEQLVVEAMRLGLKEGDVLKALSARWAELSAPQPVAKSAALSALTGRNA